MVEVFKTNVEETPVAMSIIKKLLDEFPGSRISFDLDDCDRVLRVEGVNISHGRIVNILHTSGHECSVLD